jgi:hypothetical protein
MGTAHCRNDRPLGGVWGIVALSAHLSPQIGQERSRVDARPDHAYGYIPNLLGELPRLVLNPRLGVLAQSVFCEAFTCIHKDRVIIAV